MKHCVPALLLLLSLGCRTPSPTPPPALSMVAPVLYEAPTPYVLELAADERLGHWQLDGEVSDGALLCEPSEATAFDGDTWRALEISDFGGRALTAELWSRAVRGGTLLSYATEAQLDALLLNCNPDRVLEVALQGTPHNTGLPCAGEAWQHLAVSWSADSGLLSVSIDGQRGWEQTVDATSVTTGGSLVLGQRQSCVGGCLGEGLVGQLDEVALYDRALPRSRLLSHLAVAQGTSAPTIPNNDLPVRLQPQFAHNGTIITLAFSPDGRRVASAGHDTLIKIWDVDTGALVHSLNPRASASQTAIEALAFSPDGRTIASASRDKTVKLWDANTGELRHNLRLHTQSVFDVAFSPDGHLVASISVDGTVKVWDTHTGALVHDFLLTAQAYQKRLTSVRPVPDALAFNPRGGQLAAIGDGGGLFVWDIDTGTITENGFIVDAHALTFSPDGETLAVAIENDIALFEARGMKRLHVLEHPDAVFKMAFAPDGRSIVSSSFDQSARIWDVKTGGLRHALGDTGEFHAMWFDSDGNTLAAATNGLTIDFWDMGSGALRHRIDHGLGVVQVAAFSPDGAVLARAGDELHPALELFDARSGALRHRFERKPQRVRHMGFSLDGATLASATEDGVGIWDAHSGAMLRHIDLGKHLAIRFELAPDGKTVAFDGNDFDLKIVHARSGAQRHSLQHGTEKIEDIAYSPDNKHIATVTSAGHARIWRLSDGGLAHDLNLGVRGNRLAWNRAGTLLATANQDGVIQLWNPSTGALVHTLKGHAGLVLTMVFSPEGDTLASGGWDSNVLVWDAFGGALEHTLKGHKPSIDTLSFSPKGDLLAAAGMGGAVKVWDPVSGHSVKTLNRHQSNVTTVAFSPDGGELATASSDNSVHVWDTRSWALQHDLMPHADAVSALAFSPDGRLMATGGGDGAIQLRNTVSGQRVTLLSSGPRWLAFTPDNIFDASSDGAELAAMIQGSRVFGIDQMALTHNQPHTLIERLGALGHTPPEACLDAWSDDLAQLGLNHEVLQNNLGALTLLRDHYAARFERRLQRAGIESHQAISKSVARPTARILQVTVDKATGTAQVEIALEDRRGLTNYELFVNDVPAFDAPRPIQGQRVRETVQIELSGGINKIEVAALNRRAQRAFRARTTVDHDQKIKGDLYFLAFGVSDYLHDDQIPDLQYAHQDANDLLDYFTQAKKGFGAVKHRKLINAEVTPDAISNAKDFLAGASVHDTVVLFVAGHGMRDADDNHTYYYLTHNARLDDLPGTAVRFEAIEALLMGTRARNKLFLMDTCQSGEVEAELAVASAGSGARGLKARAVPMGARTARLFGAAPSGGALRVDQLQRDRFIYADLTRRSGAIVFASSRGQEYSLEGPEFANGAFTEEILNALRAGRADLDRDGAISTDELRRYVSEAVPKITSGRQHPTVDRDNLFQKFELPVVPAPGQRLETPPEPMDDARDDFWDE